MSRIWPEWMPGEWSGGAWQRMTSWLVQNGKYMYLTLILLNATEFLSKVVGVSYQCVGCMCALLQGILRRSLDSPNHLVTRYWIRALRMVADGF